MFYIKAAYAAMICT